MIVRIRAGTPDDAETLAALRWEFRAGRTPPTEDRQAFLHRCAAWMRSELRTGASWRAWVAEAEEGIVGQAWVHTIQKVPNPVDDPERHAYFSNLYVQPAARGGVGARLLGAAIDWCEAAGVDTILLWPTPRSRPLYLRHGFTDRVEFLALKLSRAPSRAPGE
jgi:GNAT superfamily N-acetyltransferase